MTEPVAGPCFQTPKATIKQVDISNYDEKINTLTQEREMLPSPKEMLYVSRGYRNLRA